MPGKHKTYGDDYESDDFEAADTLIGRNRVPSSPVKKKRPSKLAKGSLASATTKNKTPRRPVTPGSKKKKRPQSAPHHRTGHDLWMSAVKNRLTASGRRSVVSKKVGLSSNRRPQSPRHKTASEFWIDTLRKTGSGFTTESTGMNTFSGKRPRDRDMPYLSTPAYLRQKVGTEKPHKNTGDPMSKASPGTPAYKSQEEYYEQILEYKRQLAAVNQEASAMKAKVRRLEEDNLKKEKEIDSLLHPHKSEELRRTLADKRPDSGSVIHSLKQKILKLETQLRDKETAHIKLQSDLKTTKVDEMKQQMEVFYQEIMRLQHAKDTGTDKAARPQSREGTAKTKALHETVLRLNRSNEQLQAENRSLKEDLKNALDDNQDKTSSSRMNSTRSNKPYVIPGMKKDYEDMNKKELLRTVAQLEKKLERAEKMFDGSSIVSYESRAPKVQGKIALNGSLEERLDQLDKRESELLEIIEGKTQKIKQAVEEKNRWKRRCEELEKHTSTAGEYDYSESARKGSRPASASRSSQRPPSAPRSTHTPRGERPLSGRTEKSRPSSGRRGSTDSGVSSVRRQKIQLFKENRSAKTIQRKWRNHKETEKQKQSFKEKTGNKMPFEHSNRVSSTENVKHSRTMEKLLQSETQGPVNLESLGLSHAVSKSPKANSQHASIGDDKEGHDLKSAGKMSSALSADNVDPHKHKQDVETFRENRAAKTIQRRWTSHQYRKHEEEREEASDLIRSALMGHTTRQRNMRPVETESEEDYETEDEEYNECMNLIRSTMLGHNQRKRRIRETNLSSTGEEDDDTDILDTPHSRRRFSSSLRSNQSLSSSQRQRPQSGRSKVSTNSVKSSSFNRSYRSRNEDQSFYSDQDDDF